MFLLHHFIPIIIFIKAPYHYLGSVFILLGLAVVIRAASLFKQARTPIKPFEPMTSLVTGGPYRKTRNPMYLGMVLVLVGFAIALGSITPFLLIPEFIVVIHLLFIVNEEKQLHDTFGDDYRDYQTRVRRWI